MVESGEERVDRHSVRLEQSGVKEEWGGGDIRKPPLTRRTPPPGSWSMTATCMMASMGAKTGRSFRRTPMRMREEEASIHREQPFSPGALTQREDALNQSGAQASKTDTTVCAPPQSPHRRQMTG